MIVFAHHHTKPRYKGPNQRFSELLDLCPDRWDSRAFCLSRQSRVVAAPSLLYNAPDRRAAYNTTKLPKVKRSGCYRCCSTAVMRGSMCLCLMRCATAPDADSLISSRLPISEIDGKQRPSRDWPVAMALSFAMIKRFKPHLDFDKGSQRAKASTRHGVPRVSIQTSLASCCATPRSLFDVQAHAVRHQAPFGVVA